MLKSYRLLVIYYLRYLKELDGERISTEERANAVRVYAQFQEKADAQKWNTSDTSATTSDGTANGNENYSSSSNKAKLLNMVVNDVQNNTADLMPEEFSGTFLSKVEIGVNYIQVLLSGRRVVSITPPFQCVLFVHQLVIFVFHSLSLFINSFYLSFNSFYTIPTRSLCPSTRSFQQLVLFVHHPIHSNNPFFLSINHSLMVQ